VERGYKHTNACKRYWYNRALLHSIYSRYQQTLDGITDWKVGDWAVFVEQGATDAWEKVDNSSVLDGSGTGNQITKWAGSGTSNTLTDSIITDNGTSVGIGDPTLPRSCIQLRSEWIT
jgi:hypothetical protein